MKYLSSAMLALTLCLAPLAQAQSAGEQLGSCMVDSLTGKEKKQLATWIFFAMAAHPDIKEFGNVTAEDQANIDKTIGALVTRLLTETCAAQLQAGYREGGQLAIQNAFELVGKVAMEELMSNNNVMASVAGYSKFIDEKKLESVLIGTK